MKVKATLTAILAFAAIGLIADLAIAKEVSIKGHNQSQVQAGCKGKGDSDGSSTWNCNGTYSVAK